MERGILKPISLILMIIFIIVMNIYFQLDMIEEGLNAPPRMVYFICLCLLPLIALILSYIGSRNAV